VQSIFDLQSTLQLNLVVSLYTYCTLSEWTVVLLDTISASLFMLHCCIHLFYYAYLALSVMHFSGCLSVPCMTSCLKIARDLYSKWLTKRQHQLGQHMSWHELCDGQYTCILHCVSKRIPNIFSYNSSKNCPICIIFGSSINKRLVNQIIVYFPSSSA